MQNSNLLPPTLLGIYKETHEAVCSGLSILAGIGVRAIVETICKDKEASGRNLERKIDSLVEMSVLTPRQAGTLHSTRLMGNQAAHEVQQPNNEQLKAAMDVVENLLGSIYIMPKVAEVLPQQVLTIMGEGFNAMAIGDGAVRNVPDTEPCVPTDASENQNDTPEDK